MPSRAYMNRLKSECLDKTQYLELEDAEAVVDHVFDEEGVELRIYLCEHCGGYHLTRMTEEEYRQRRRHGY